MTVTEALPLQIDDAYERLFTSAERLADKLDYRAGPQNRSVLELLRECVTMPGFLAPMLIDRKLPPMDGSPDQSHLTDVAACRAEWTGNREALFAAIRAFPHDALGETVDTPWGTFTWLQMLDYAQWNVNYHAGQLAYVELTHGITEM